MKNNDITISLGFKQADSPFGDVIVDRNGVACFQSDEIPKDETVDCIRTVKWGECAYGASDCQIYPFYVSIKEYNNQILGIDVLRAVKARIFKSDHITDLYSNFIKHISFLFVCPTLKITGASAI